MATALVTETKGSNYKNNHQYCKHNGNNTTDQTSDGQTTVRPSFAGGLPQPDGAKNNSGNSQKKAATKETQHPYLNTI